MDEYQCFSAIFMSLSIDWVIPTAFTDKSASKMFLSYKENTLFYNVFFTVSILLSARTGN